MNKKVQGEGFQLTKYQQVSDLTRFEDFTGYIQAFTRYLHDAGKKSRLQKICIKMKRR